MSIVSFEGLICQNITLIRAQNNHSHPGIISGNFVNLTSKRKTLQYFRHIGLIYRKLAQAFLDMNRVDNSEVI